MKAVLFNLFDFNVDMNSMQIVSNNLVDCIVLDQQNIIMKDTQMLFQNITSQSLSLSIIS